MFSHNGDKPRRRWSLCIRKLGGYSLCVWDPWLTSSREPKLFHHGWVSNYSLRGADTADTVIRSKIEMIAYLLAFVAFFHEILSKAANETDHAEGFKALVAVASITAKAMKDGV